MMRIVLSSFVAAIVLFVFGAAFWTCPIPYAYVEKATVADAELSQVLRNALPNDGLYLVPSPAGDPEALQKLYRQGPVVTIHYHKDGVEPMAPAVLVQGFFHGYDYTAALDAPPVNVLRVYLGAIDHVLNVMKPTSFLFLTDVLCKSVESRN